MYLAKIYSAKTPIAYLIKFMFHLRQSENLEICIFPKTYTHLPASGAPFFNAFASLVTLHPTKIYTPPAHQP